MTTAAISSLPCCAATPECPTALEAAAAARFGDGIFAFGAFVMKAVGRHLARGAHDGAAVQQPVGVQPSPETSAEAILKAKRARETVPPEGQRPAPTEVPRAPGKRRATAAPGMQ